MELFRASGILLHPTSLPGPYGIGDFGEECKTFIDFLILTEQKVWQINPLGPTGYGDSPYQCFSSFAGNPLLINLQKLEAEGWLVLDDFANEKFTTEKVDYEKVQQFKKKALKKAYQSFLASDEPLIHKKFLNFCEQQGAWLEDFSLFMALKDHFKGKAWDEWDKELVQREPKALEKWQLKLDEAIGFHQFTQFLFSQQWQEIKSYCNINGIKILGDLPLFPSYDSADVWMNPELFYLDENKKMTHVAGVPPDYFSDTGQLWGNPLYRWNVMREDQYVWWKNRIKASLVMVDILRLDHFRGFYSYWEIPMGKKDAREGRWVLGPGEEFFTSLEDEFGALPFIAEDLGIIPPAVEHLREMFGFAGMKILQFAFGGESDHQYLPHNFDKNFVVYTGTHDNETVVNWWETADEKVKEKVLRYIGKQHVVIHRDMMRIALASSAHLAILPLQDVLGLGEEARMNTPGKAEGNWSWRFTPEQITKEIMETLGNLTRTFGR